MPRAIGRYTDSARVETFPADFDQPHAVNVFGAYTFRDGRSRVGATLHAGSNFPLSGYLSRRGDSLFVGADRNRVRLPAYSRLDLHAQRGFDYAGKRLTLFVDVLNVLDRRNLGRAQGSIDISTGVATGFTAPLLSRRVSGGIVVDF